MQITTEQDKLAMAFIAESLAALRESGVSDDDLQTTFQLNLVRLLLRHKLIEMRQPEEKGG